MKKEPFDDLIIRTFLCALEIATAVFGLVQSFQAEIILACQIVVVVSLIVLAFTLIMKK